MPNSSEAPAGCIEVSTGARLHFGLLSHGREAASNHGGCGMMVDAPGCVLRIVRNESDAITIVGEATQDVADVVRRVRDRVRESTGWCARLVIDVVRVVPRHAGLGSGTQLAAAVVLGMSRAAGEARLTVEELRRRSGRGRRSSIGLHGALTGGFLVDAGHSTDGGPGRLDSRLEPPQSWRVVLLTPLATTGLSSDAEHDAFASLPPTSAEHVSRLTGILTREVVPAIRSGDFHGFSRSLYEYGRLVGDAFAPVQGGTYSHRSTAEIVGALRDRGVLGVGQTSWGPTVFAFAESVADANEIAAFAHRSCSPDEVAIRVVRPLDRGASTTVRSPADS